MSRQLQVRLPDDHWIWELTDGYERSAEVRRALDFYRRFGGEFAAVRNVAEEIKTILAEGNLTFVGQETATRSESGSLPDNDPRFAALDKFLNL